MRLNVPILIDLQILPISNHQSLLSVKYSNNNYFSYTEPISLFYQSDKKKSVSGLTQCSLSQATITDCQWTHLLQSQRSRSFSFLWREARTKSPDLSPSCSSLCFPRRGHKPHYTISEKIGSTSWPRNAPLSPGANNGGQVLRHYVAGGSHYQPIRSRAFSSFQILSLGYLFPSR